MLLQSEPQFHNLITFSVFKIEDIHIFELGAIFFDLLLEVLTMIFTLLFDLSQVDDFISFRFGHFHWLMVSIKLMSNKELHETFPDLMGQKVFRQIGINSPRGCICHVGHALLAERWALPIRARGKLRHAPEPKALILTRRVAHGMHLIETQMGRQDPSKSVLNSSWALDRLPI